MARSASNLLSASSFVRQGAEDLFNVPNVIRNSGLFFKLKAETDGPKENLIKKDRSILFFSPGDDIIEGHQHTWLDGDDNLKTLAKTITVAAAGAAGGLVLGAPGAAGAAATSLAALEAAPFLLAAAGRPSAFLITLNSVYQGSGTFSTGFTTHLISIDDPVKQVIEPATFIRDVMYGHVGSENINFQSEAIDLGPLTEAGQRLGAKFQTLTSPPRWELSIGTPPTNYWAKYPNLICTECNVNWRGPFVNGLPTKAQIDLRFTTARQIEGGYFQRDTILADLSQLRNITQDPSTLSNENPLSQRRETLGGPIVDLATERRGIDSEETAAILGFNTSNTISILSGVLDAQATISGMTAGVERTALQAQQALIGTSSDTLKENDDKIDSLFDDGSLDFFGWSSVIDFQQSFDKFSDENDTLADELETGITLAKSFGVFPGAAALSAQWEGLKETGSNISSTSLPLKESLATIRNKGAIGGYLKGLVT